MELCTKGVFGLPARLRTLSRRCRWRGTVLVGLLRAVPLRMEALEPRYLRSALISIVRSALTPPSIRPSASATFGDDPIETR